MKLTIFSEKIMRMVEAHGFEASGIEEDLLLRSGRLKHASISVWCSGLFEAHVQSGTEKELLERLKHRLLQGQQSLLLEQEEQAEQYLDQKEEARIGVTLPP